MINWAKKLNIAMGVRKNPKEIVRAASTTDGEDLVTVRLDEVVP